MQWLDRKWQKVVEKKLAELEEDEPFGEIIVHGGNDISDEEAHSDVREERMDQVTNVVFLLNITKVGDHACYEASILVADIPKGITSIGGASFAGCISLKDIKFPKSLTKIGEGSFMTCFGLEQVDLLHTNVEELGDYAFKNCTSLREMKVPDSLQTFGHAVFYACFELVPSDIDINIYSNDVTSEVVAYLRSKQSDDSKDWSDIEVEEVTINGTTYSVEVGNDDEERAICNVTEDSDDELGDEIGFMLNGEAEFE